LVLREPIEEIGELVEVQVLRAIQQEREQPVLRELKEQEVPQESPELRSLNPDMAGQ
jgi:hypothetical protein